MIADIEALARLITLESGKPLAEARGEVRYAADYLRSAAEQADALLDEPFDGRREGLRTLAIREPIGVCAAVTPWNFPVAMLARKVAPALAAGCTVVAKPAEETPLSALAFTELLVDRGLPEGVLNTIAGDPDAIVNIWLADPRVRKLTFTGSTETGRLLLRRAADQVVRCSMELGGHAAFIVLEGADLELAVTGAMAAKFRNAGQTCICPNRFLVHHSLAPAFAARLALAASSLSLGPGIEAATQIGPLINDAGVTKVRSHVADALAQGPVLFGLGQRGVEIGEGGEGDALSGLHGLNRERRGEMAFAGAGWTEQMHDLAAVDEGKLGECQAGGLHRREVFLPIDMAQPSEGAERLLRHAKGCRQGGGLPLHLLRHAFLVKLASVIPGRRAVAFSAPCSAAMARANSSRLRYSTVRPSKVTRVTPPV